MVNSDFMLFAALAADLCEGSEAAFQLVDLLPQLASRGQPRDEIGPAKTAQIRAVPTLSQICSLKLPLDHFSGDTRTW